VELERRVAARRETDRMACECSCVLARPRMFHRRALLAPLRRFPLSTPCSAFGFRFSVLTSVALFSVLTTSSHFLRRPRFGLAHLQRSPIYSASAGGSEAGEFFHTRGDYLLLPLGTLAAPVAFFSYGRSWRSSHRCFLAGLRTRIDQGVDLVSTFVDFPGLRSRA
jgi:hypothetical protein